MALPPASQQRCARCGQRAANWHHRLPRSRGGPDDPINLVALCGSGTTGCHGWVEHHPEQARRDRWTIPGYMLRGVYVGPDDEYQTLYRKEAV